MPTTKLNRRFVKDFVLPIPIYKSEYFYYYINLFNPVYNSKAKYDMFLDLYDELGNDDEMFFQYSAKIQQTALERIKNSPAYNDFINDTRDLFTGYKWIVNSLPKGQVYKAENDGRHFLSIDLKKANYQALKFYTRQILKQEPSENDIILGTSTFDEFIDKFTNEKYFKEAKKFRQVIFGNMNPKRQQKIQKFIINELLKFIFDNSCLGEKFLKDYTSDEVVFDITDIDNKDLYGTIDLVKEKTKEMDIDVRFDIYRLKALLAENVNPMFVREFSTGETDFKCIENSLMPQVYKYYFGIETNKQDLMFYAPNGLLASYNEPLQWL